MSAARSTPQRQTETTSYYARILQDDVPLAVDILADILTESSFDEDELQREKQVILQEIGAANDTPDDVVFDKFAETAFANQTIGRPILGTPETVLSFTPETDPHLSRPQLHHRPHVRRRCRCDRS